ncbi:MAG: methyl-accepting chemotaxis protein [Pseudomonadota bacterium]|nr:methyl-accepting chemotaxis protein [Pseudomonadota bacterium]
MLNNVKIRTLIISTIAFVIAMLLLIGGLGGMSLRNTSTIMQNTAQKDANLSARMVERIRFKMEVNRSQILQALQHNPTTEWAALHDHPLAVHFKTIDETSASIRQLLATYQAAIDAPEERQLANDWIAKSGKLGMDLVASASASVQQGKWDDAERTLIGAINPAYRNSDPAEKALLALLAKRAELDRAAVFATISGTAYLMGGTILAASLLSVCLGALLIRGIMRPLAQAIEIARSVAAGRLSGTVTTGAHNEIGQLIQALGDMDASLFSIVRDVRSATDTIDSASVDIASSNLELSNRTEAAAAALEETAASMVEMTETVRRNGSNAMQANALSLSAAEVAGKGGAVVSQVVTTMGSINASASKIVAIIDVIEGIAFQTNILALNAAVEAARAGDQGRGFAVVASEVRNLAQRSAGAAKEIKSLIDHSVAQVTVGTRLVDQAGKTMDDIVSSVNKVTAIVAEISTAGREQSEGIDHINNAIHQMDHSTQQNARMVEDAAKATGALEQQAKTLVQLVSVFQLAGSAPAAHARAAPAAPHSMIAAAPPRRRPTPA